MSQVICLGTPYVQAELQEKLNSYKDILFTTPDKLDTGSPSLYLYFGDSDSDKKCTNENISLEQLVKQSIVLPVIRDSSTFSTFIPDELGSINAIIIPSEKDVDKLKNRVLEWFGKIEVNRKVFISYKRTDSMNLAMQLYEALIKSHYTPFLDSYSINSGVDFQEHLLHELADSSVFLFINSANYEFSNFTMLELTAASRLQIGVLEVRMAGSKTYKEAEFAEVYPLQKIVAPDMLYPAEVIRDIISSIEESRASLHEFKQQALLDQVKAKMQNITIVPLENNLLFSYNNKCYHYYYPVFHGPLSTDFHKAEEALKTRQGEKKIVYNGLHCRRDVSEHISWLNKSLPFEAIDVNE